MSSVKLYKPSGEAAGELTVDERLLVLDRGDQAVKESVVATLNRRRAGTASTLRKGEVAGSNKKPWKQKGTGRARAGVRQSPVWRGGGVAFGPKPRDYAVGLNRKVAQLAFRRALSARVAEGRVSVVEEFALPEARTRHVAALLKRLGLRGGCLIVTAAPDAALVRAARNLPKVTVASAAQVDVYSLLCHRNVVASRAGWDALAARLARKTEEAA